MSNRAFLCNECRPIARGIVGNCQHFDADLARAVEAEREACAKVAEDETGSPPHPGPCCSRLVAAAIRARSIPPDDAERGRG